MAAAYSELVSDYNRLKAGGEPDTTNRMSTLLRKISEHPIGRLVKEVTNQIIELDRELDNLNSLGLTEEEKENFLQKAIEQVQPYYDRKSQEIESGIQEGKLRTAEDVLLFTRDVQNELTAELSSLDLRQAETEEDFINMVSEITSGRDENITAKNEEWRLRLEGVKMDQIQSGIFSSGIGRKKREDTERLRQLETGTIESQAGRQVTDVETQKKYSIDQIRLSREAAERDRAARIGAPQTQEALRTLGLSDISQLGPKTGIEQARQGAGRNVDIYKPGALNTLEEERLKAVESRKQESQTEELALRNQEYERKRQKILADKAAAQSRVSGYARILCRQQQRTTKK